MASETSPSPKDQRPQTRRRTVRFGLRALLIMVAVVAVVLWFNVQPAQRQRRAVARLQELGGHIRYDYQDGNLNAEPPGPRWLRDLVGIDYFATADFVFFHGNSVHDQDLTILQDLPQLRQVNFSNCAVTGDGLVHIQGLSHLTVIGLGGTNATDRALENLRDMTQLEVLSIGQYPLSGSHVTDDGLAHVAGLKKLWRLDLDTSPIADPGLIHLEGLTNLIDLSLKGTRVTDEGVARLQKKLPKCEIFR